MCQWPYFKEMDLLNLLVLSNENLGLKSNLRQIRHFKERLSLFKHTNVFLMDLVYICLVVTFLVGRDHQQDAITSRPSESSLSCGLSAFRRIMQ